MFCFWGELQVTEITSDYLLEFTLSVTSTALRHVISRHGSTALQLWLSRAGKIYVGDDGFTFCRLIARSNI